MFWEAQSYRQSLCQRRAALTSQGGALIIFTLASRTQAVLTSVHEHSAGTKMKLKTLFAVSLGAMPLLIGDIGLAAPPKRQQIGVPPVATSPIKPSTFEGAEPGDDKIKIKVSEDGKTIFVAGEMVFGTYRKFARVLKSAPAVRTVHLGSPGGIVLEGFLMSALVRERKLNTYVETFCSSSCTQVLVAGADRAAAPLAKIGFHASASVEEDDAETPAVPDTPLFKSNDKNQGPVTPVQPASPPDENDDLIFKSSFVRSGVAQDFITRAFTTPHTDMWYPSSAEMVTARILTRTSAGDEIKLVPGIGMARSALEENLLKRDIWQQAKLLRPVTFEAAIGEALRVSQIGTTEAAVVNTAEAELADTLMDELATAPPAIVDGFALLALDLMNADPLSYFSSCGRAAGVKPDREPIKTPDLDAREDKLLVALMQSKEQAKPLSYSKAGKLIGRLLVSEAGTSAESDDAQTCKDAKALIITIASLPQKKRAEAYRALLVYGGDDESQVK
jgi:hypothetical protein